VSDEYMSMETAMAFCDEARQALARAEQERRAAAKDLAAASYEREAAERRHRDTAELEANIRRREADAARRERDQASIIAAEANAARMLEEAKSVMAEFSADKQGAARALRAIDERDRAAKAEREAARGKAAA
jgi:colicin import membrane protein